MKTQQTQAHAGCVAVHLDAEEITSAILGTAFVERHWLEKVRSIESFKEAGWRHQVGLAFGAIAASKSLASKLGNLGQYCLPFRAWAIGIGGAQ